MHGDTRISRRASLVKLGGLVVATAAGWKVADSESASAGPSAVSSGAVSCVLAPEQTQGPYYVPGDKVRRNVTEGKPGVPLALELTVVDVATCRAIKGAAVDIWHCDAGGVYSETSVQGRRAARSYARSSGPTRRGSPPSGRSIPAGIPGAPCTST